MPDRDDLPLTGLRVVEFTHMVMGPTIGLILADLGADVTRIEPTGGDRTRALSGSGAGYFAMYNRNKRSVCLDLKSAPGVQLARRLASCADVLVENFRPGVLERLGLGYDALAPDNPGLIYCSAKGFLSGPYENRVALDEVAQMMGGLAYMTGPTGRPLRAGASVIDVTGGMFGVIGILALLERRHRSGVGGRVNCSLFETTAFLVGQHMAQLAVTGKPAAPMPERVSAWAIYDVFDTVDAQQIFVAVVSDAQWRSFCSTFKLIEFELDPDLQTNNDRIAQRDRILPAIRALFASRARDELLAQLEGIGVPAAKIGRPEDLFADEQLNANEGLVEVTLPGGGAARLPALPVELDGRRCGLRLDLRQAGEDSRDVLGKVGVSEEELAALQRDGVVA
ncbi:MAG: CaiB/BaiF CoA-transferase family protein [Pseudomonadota bacterium]|jgi:crotonobetainyl-CoA:carnitine CoA-transferase CaiB-like acyl-CoA transferase|nr:CaiB/BaiF CoA-transferase family protein [Pseudomonadota bacterium]